MKGIDIILIALIAVVLFFAVRRTIKTRRSGGCGCGCTGCTDGTGCQAKKFVETPTKRK